MPISAKYQHPIVIDQRSMRIPRTRLLPQNILPRRVVHHLLVHHPLAVLLVADDLQGFYHVFGGGREFALLVRNGLGELFE